MVYEENLISYAFFSFPLHLNLKLELVYKLENVWQFVRALKIQFYILFYFESNVLIHSDSIVLNEKRDNELHYYCMKCYEIDDKYAT